MPKKIRAVEKLIIKAGWINRGDKGNHRNYVHPGTGAVVTLCGKSGDDCPRYVESQITIALEQNT